MTEININPTFSGEVQLAGWSDTHTGGAKITFWLPDADNLEVFKGLTAKKGNTAGHRFACVLVEIGDDELPVIERTEEVLKQAAQAETRADKPKGGKLAKLAGILCNYPRFWAYLNTCGVGLNIDSAIDARYAIYEICDIGSRAHLDNNPDAAAKFHRLIRIPYVNYLKRLEEK